MRRLALLLLALLAAAFVAPAANAQRTNMVRVMHASPDGPAVDVYVDGRAALTDLAFFAYSDYLALPDGTYDIAVTPAGAPISEAVLAGPLQVSGGYAGTLAVINFADAIEAVLYEDTIDPVPAGKARVRVIHASPNAPAVDVKLAGTSTLVVQDAPFKATAYVELDAGSYRFDISRAGEVAALFTTPALRFESGWIYTLVATGDLEQNFWVQARVDRVGQ